MPYRFANPCPIGNLEVRKHKWLCTSWIFKAGKGVRMRGLAFNWETKQPIASLLRLVVLLLECSCPTPSFQTTCNWTLSDCLENYTGAILKQKMYPIPDWQVRVKGQLMGLRDHPPKARKIPKMHHQKIGIIIGSNTLTAIRNIKKQKMYHKKFFYFSVSSIRTVTWIKVLLNSTGSVFQI